MNVKCITPTIKTTISAALVAAGMLAGTAVVPMTVFALTVTGTNGPDTLKGTNSVDTIYGNGGDDRIHGYKGDDTLYGGRGDDRIWGGSGDDSIYAWHGNNHVSGGDGSDIIYATGDPENNDVDYNNLKGYNGNDKFIVRDSGATIRGGGGNDIVDAIADAGFGGFLIYTGSGDDYARVVDNQAEVFGGDGDDKLIATGEAVHEVFGEDGHDWIRISTDVGSIAKGGDGDDYILSTFEGTLYGQEGNDILESRNEIAFNNMIGGRGADEFRCYGGYDAVEDFDQDEGDTILGTCESINGS